MSGSDEMAGSLPANEGDMGSIPELEGSLEKEMTTHSSICAWDTPWTEELVGYRHDLATEQQQTCKSVHFSSVAQSCLTLCDPMDCSMPGLPVHCQLPELTQTHVH